LRPLKSHRIRLVLLALAMVAVACGGGAAKSEGDGDVGAGVEFKDTTTTVKGAPATTAAPATQATAKAGSATTAKAGTSGSKGTAAPLPTVAPSPGSDPIVNAAKGPGGGAAGIILQPTPAKQLILEILEEPGVKANKIAVDEVIKDLRELSGKPVSEVHNPLPAGSKGKQWTEAELAKLADANSKIPQGGDKFVFKFIYVNGSNARSSSILGVAFRGDLFAAFPDQYEGTTTPQRVITTVTVHETGHLLGMVDLFLKTGRADTKNDPAKGGHSSNKNSVMYWAVDPFLFGGFFGSASEKFDADDLKDLAAIRNGAKPGSKG
jgi:hypothetical protein